MVKREVLTPTFFVLFDLFMLGLDGLVVVLDRIFVLAALKLRQAQVVVEAGLVGRRLYCILQVGD